MAYKPLHLPKASKRAFKGLEHLCEDAHILPKRRLLFRESRAILDNHKQATGFFKEHLLEYGRLVDQKAALQDAQPAPELDSRISNAEAAVESHARLLEAKMSEKDRNTLAKAANTSQNISQAGLLGAVSSMGALLIFYLKGVPALLGTEAAILQASYYFSLLASAITAFKFGMLEEKFYKQLGWQDKAKKIAATGKIELDGE